MFDSKVDLLFLREMPFLGMWKRLRAEHSAGMDLWSRGQRPEVPGSVCVTQSFLAFDNQLYHPAEGVSSVQRDKPKGEAFPRVRFLGFLETYIIKSGMYV